MKLYQVALPLALALAAMPASAQDDVPRQVRGFADATAGAQAPADKVLHFGRRASELVVTSMEVVAAGGSPRAVPDAVAVLRTRAAPGSNRDMPLASDFDFVRRTGARLFVVGEWATPAVMWEVTPHAEHGVRFRLIGPDGAPGAWAVPANVPASN